MAPRDLAPAYDSTPGHEEWNARYKALSVVTGRRPWVDHCTFSDGPHPDRAEIRTVAGVTKPVQRHDGLLDIEDGSDLVTVSYCRFQDHDKTSMVGGSGLGSGPKERAFNRLTFSHNHYRAVTQHAPLARFGPIHVYNSVLEGDTDTDIYPVRSFLGTGVESRLFSEGNDFTITGSGATVAQDGGELVRPPLPGRRVLVQR